MSIGDVSTSIRQQPPVMVARNGSDIVIHEDLHCLIQITYPIRQISGAGDLIDTLIVKVI